jgi:surface polysaccharide O-acyltransferase-like enzyme
MVTILNVNQAANEKTRIAHLDNLRTIAIIMVVGVHTLSYCVPLPSNQLEIITLIVQAIAVPIFFLVDGYLFAHSTSKTSIFKYQNYITKSFSRLVVPWMIFTLIYTFARYISESLGLLETQLIVGHSLKNIVISAYGSVYSSQMYFLLSLFLIRLISPVTKAILIRNSLTNVLIISLIYLIIYKSTSVFIKPYLRIEGGQEPLLHALWGIQYYLIGIVAFKAWLVVDIRKFFIPSILLFILVFIFKNNLLFANDLIQYFYLISLFLFFTLFQKKLPLLSIIGQNSMGIYLIHIPIVLKSTSLILNKIVTNPIASFIITLTTTMLVSLIIVEVINRTPFGSFLFGTFHQKNKTS